MKTDIILQCPKHASQLTINESGVYYLCSEVCSYPIINGIPRFVPEENFASSFGLQWNTYRKTQLDSHTGLSISRERLTRLVGGSLNILKDKEVLEAGCGAGRFTEVLLEAGARVFAADISTAVAANYENCKTYPNYFVCQADIVKLPVQPQQFDIVICIGVIQHTPNPEETMTALCSYVKPGGLLVIDHYTYGYPGPVSRRLLRKFLLRMPKHFSLRFCQAMTASLWPVHRALWKLGNHKLIRIIRSRFVNSSPVVDYHEAYPQLGPDLLRCWAVLDTHDTLTDYYKHLRSAEEIKAHLERCGMTDIETVYAGNGVEARGKRPLNQS